MDTVQTPTLTLQLANSLASLPLACVKRQYPNKLGQTLGSADDLAEPEQLHPAFYGCFDWHSSVHGHWSLVALLRKYPTLEKADTIREVLRNSLSKENIEQEVAYFNGEHNQSFERTYGWSWLLKLAQELHLWEDPLARELEKNLQPLTDLIRDRYLEFLPKLVYPIRVGTHTNTAFGLVFPFDYALATGDTTLQRMIRETALRFYLDDHQCPLGWEPSGYDFLSPCLEEVDLMRRVMEPQAFRMWLTRFLPQLTSPDFHLEPGKVSDREDGHLVHLDGLNFSRAWVLYGLARQYPEYEHLLPLANRHMHYSLPHLAGDTYEGGHWLGSFAIYAMERNSQ